MSTRSNQPNQRCHAVGTARLRRGSVLLVVLVAVALLSLGAYAFSESMISEYESTTMYGRAAQARVYAESGIEKAALVVGDRVTYPSEMLYHEPALFQNMLMRDSEEARGRGRFSLVAPVESIDASVPLRFGLIDEGSKLNVNTILSYELEDEAMYSEMLMYLPEMTYELADAILDYIDEDFEPREFGVEDDLSSDPPIPAKNAPLETLDELLLVPGVDSWLLYGEDTNRNGLLDLNEDDGDLTPPFDNGDGVLQLGWSQFLTVTSREINLMADGTERINVNNSTLTDLYDELELELGTEYADFVVAFRMNGPIPEEIPEEEENPQGGSGGTVGSSTNQEEQALQNAAAAVAGAVAGGGDAAVTRGGMDLSGGGSVTIESLYELIGSAVEVEIEGELTLIESPWTADPGDMQSYLPTMMDLLTTVDDPYIEGRININQTRFEVIRGLPGMTDGLADSIVRMQLIGSNGEPLSDAMTERATTGWLVTQGLVDISMMRDLDKYITARGDVYRVQSVGYFDEGGPTVRMEAIIDGTEYPPRIVYMRELDLKEVGKGYTYQQLSFGAVE